MTATVKPILFSGPMIRALLDGRKTQTRRVLKPQPADTDAAGKPVRQVADYCTGAPEHGKAYYWQANGCWNSSEPFRLPYAPGDLLWVREGLRAASNDQARRWLSYAADDSAVWPLTQWTNVRDSAPSIHMPRWASRLTLRVTDIRVQRLQSISEADAIAEGIRPSAEHDDGRWIYPISDEDYVDTAQASFRALWDSINEARAPWSSNPWVAAISFDLIKANVDQVLQEAA